MAFIKELYVEDYRGIHNLRIGDLKPVNLIVGDNNFGKTSVLEAIQLLRTSGNLANVYKVARQRDVLAISNANSIYDSFICIFPHRKEGDLNIAVLGKSNKTDISFTLSGRKDRILLDAKELQGGKYRISEIPDGEVEAEAFEGELILKYGKTEKMQHISVNQYSSITGTSSAEKDQLNIVYVAPFDHLKGSIINRILRNESYKQVCIRALQLFDPDIDDLMIFRSDIGNRPVEYIRHKKLGDMPVSTYVDGLKKVLVIANAIAQAAGGILLFDEAETSIHRKYYDDIFRFAVRACKTFDVQLFITTHSIEAIDGILATQDYDKQEAEDDICVCTLKREGNDTLSRALTGREVYENRESFGFEVRL